MNDSIIQNMYLKCASLRIDLMNTYDIPASGGAIVLEKHGTIGISGPPRTARTMKRYMQDGETLDEQTMTPRKIRLRVACIGATQADIAQQRYRIYQLLSSVSTPPDSQNWYYVELHVELSDGRDLVLFCHPDDDGVVFSETEYRNGVVGTISLIAYDPIWYSNELKTVTVNPSSGVYTDIALPRGGGDISVYPEQISIYVPTASYAFYGEIVDISSKPVFGASANAGGYINISAYPKPDRRGKSGSGTIYPETQFAKIDFSTTWRARSNVAGSQFTVAYRDGWSAI